MASMTGRIDVPAAADTLIADRRKALAVALEYLLSVANQLVPNEEGTLERSGRVQLVDDNTGAVVYDTPYAAVQHERLDYRHSAGRQAKYLEQPMQTEREVILALIAATLRRANR